MAKLAPSSIKYLIKAKVKAKSVIEKPDIIGAIFGQTEGLLGSELDLRELQKTGRIGRIEVSITSKNGKTEGEIVIPSALDSAETSLIAATLETIERVGPCEAKITLEKVEDVRSDKRKYVIDKAKKILKDLMESGGESDEMSDEIKESVRTGEITTYQGLPAGPELADSEAIIIVEGRADILNLLKYGVKNTIAVGGTGSSGKVASLAKERTATVFVDGDRGGKLIVKELMQRTSIDFVATAPEGKEVEELTQKEVYKALREKVPAEQWAQDDSGSRSSGFRERKSYRDSRNRYDRKQSGRKFDRRERRPYPDRRSHTMRQPKPEEKELFKKAMKDVEGKKSACIFNDKGEMLGKVPVADLTSTLRGMDNSYAVVLDGKVDYRLSAAAKSAGVRFLVGTDKEEINTPVTILTKKDL